MVDGRSGWLHHTVLELGNLTAMNSCSLVQAEARCSSLGVSHPWWLSATVVLRDGACV